MGLVPAPAPVAALAGELRGATLFACFVVLAVSLLLFWGWSRQKAAPTNGVVGVNGVADASKDNGGVDPTAAQVDRLFRSLGLPEAPHEEGYLHYSDGGVSQSNMEEPRHFNMESCDGFFLSMHRATHDKELDKSCAYRYGEYFRGKSRKWEARLQIRFKVPPKVDEIFFGIELSDYVPLGSGAERTMGLVVRAIKSVVGDQVYHSVGDDPQKTSGEVEQPVFVMPMLAFDQYIVTPEGEEPPCLADPNISKMGSRRFKRVKEYRAELDQLEFKVGPTYTLCFWGISRFFDKIKWQVTLPLNPFPIDINLFCGGQPISVVMYTLKDAKDDGKRHLQSRKNYFLKLPFWSSLVRPSWKKLDVLLGASGVNLKGWPASSDPETWQCFMDDRMQMSESVGSSNPNGSRRRNSSWMACCTERDR